jgi:hypothetical protein
MELGSHFWLLQEQIKDDINNPFVPWALGILHTTVARALPPPSAAPRDMCCLLVLDSGTSTPQWIRQPKPRVYLQEGTYHTRLFEGPSTTDMKK